MSGRPNLADLAQAVAAHGIRIQHIEDAGKGGALQAHGEALAGQAVSLAMLASRMDHHEKLLTSMRTWLIGVLASSVGTLAVLLFETIRGGK